MAYYCLSELQRFARILPEDLRKIENEDGLGFRLEPRPAKDLFYVAGALLHPDPAC
jgi:hypothetical protein